ncbi:MAG: hemerythrin domain-containing protein, partial [Desulfomonilia bacterium]
GKIDSALIEKMLDFFRNFTDKCHHAKEEKHLFPMLERRGVPRDKGPVGVMLAEHNEGRRLLSNISELLPAATNGDSDAVMSIAVDLAAYVTLLEKHIQKENEVLFQMADRVLTAEDQNHLEAAFARVEKEETGEGIHEKYHALAHEISDSLSRR